MKCPAADVEFLLHQHKPLYALRTPVDRASIRWYTGIRCTSDDIVLLPCSMDTVLRYCAIVEQSLETIVQSLESSALALFLIRCPSGVSYYLHRFSQAVLVSYGLRAVPISLARTRIEVRRLISIRSRASALRTIFLRESFKPTFSIWADNRKNRWSIGRNIFQTTYILLTSSMFPGTKFRWMG